MFEEENALTGAQTEEDLFEGWAADEADQAEDAQPDAQEHAAQPAQEAAAEDDPSPAGETAETDDPSASGAGEAQRAQDGPGAEEPKYKVKVRGQEYELPVSELIVHAQKGMDYDNVRGRLEAVSPAVRLVEQYAAASGMTLEQYLEAAQQGLQEQAVQRRVAAGVPEEEARRLTAQEAELAQLRAEKARQEAARQAQEAQAARVDPYLALLKEYPQIKSTGDMPPQVMERIAAGETPLSAYRAWENEQLKAQMAARRAEQKNRRAAPGSADGLNGREQGDAFSAGFDAAFEF